MSQTIDKFVEYLRYEKSGGLAEGTIERYLLNLRHLASQAGKDLLEIKTYQEISSYIRSLREKNRWSSSTTKNAADTYSVFFNWAFRYGLIQDSPMRLGHEFKNKDRKQMDFFDWDSEDFKKLIYNPNNSIKDNAILHTLRSSGVRASDLCNFTFSDVDIKDRWFFVRGGKGGVDRHAPFDEETQMWLSIYIPLVKNHSSEKWLFQTEDFKQFKPQTLYKLISRKAEKLGIHACPQKFRRSLGGELIARGADLTVVQKTLGHARASTTADYYVHFKSEKLKEQYDKFIPKMKAV